MKVIGITGGIGAGKTTVCKIFESIGIHVYYADQRARWLMNHNKSLKKSIRELLGDDAYHRNGRLDRSRVAGLIFQNKELLERINALVHPAVARDAMEWLQDHQEEDYVLYEAALLVENGSYKNFAEVIVVTAPLETRIERVTSRDKVSREQVMARVRNQLPQEEKVALADFIIDNSGKFSLIRQVWDIHQKLISGK